MIYDHNGVSKSTNSIHNHSVCKKPISIKDGQIEALYYINKIYIIKLHSLIKHIAGNQNIIMCFIVAKNVIATHST